ncbi:trimethylamine monooxygenase-like [Convolutriloba macropyga]|uniref:trimethylamine monooxygenase-like n=1 Tax=Convolutriloba macropyga TaxID=536237 RepID=UPI003F520153
MRKQRVCVIGAGPSGLTTLRALQCNLDQDNYEVVCYERYDSVGGVWNFTGVEGIEEDGIEVHSGMYHNLISNGAKQLIELPELLFPLDVSNVTGFPFYPDRPYLLNYLKEYADKFDLHKYITFSTWVDNVSYDKKLSKFQVKTINLPTKEESEETFDYVIVASGHFNYPNYVSYPGQDTFPGLIIHSKQFMDASRYSGKRILLVGAAYSAEDIATQSMAAGAVYVTISYRSRPMGANWPKGIDERPLLEKIDKQTVSFKDGSKRDFDVIIYCTGYLHKFPFLEEDLMLKTRNRLVVPLYKGVVFPNNPRLMYIGMQDQYYTFSMFWLQGHLCAKFINGGMEVPSEEEMRVEIAQEEKEEDDKVKTVYDEIDFQTKYVNELHSLTKDNGYTVSVDVAEIFYKWEEDRMRDMGTYKHQTHFKSIFR